MENKTTLKQKFFRSNFIKRTMSALILIPIVLYVIILGSNPFKCMIVILNILMLYEWFKIVNNKTVEINIYTKLFWYIIGFIYTISAGFSLIYLRDLQLGKEITLWLFLTVWAIDTGAYVTGNIIGGPKIIPSISPNKTWSGLFGGMFFAALICPLIQSYFGRIPLTNIAISIIITVIAQFGDFAESGFKRYFKVKNSSMLIPGHGGILDRVDGLVTASIFMVMINYYLTITQ